MRKRKNSSIISNRRRILLRMNYAFLVVVTICFTLAMNKNIYLWRIIIISLHKHMKATHSAVDIPGSGTGIL